MIITMHVEHHGSGCQRSMSAEVDFHGWGEPAQIEFVVYEILKQSALKKLFKRAWKTVAWKEKFIKRMT